MTVDQLLLLSLLMLWLGCSPYKQRSSKLTKSHKFNLSTFFLLKNAKFKTKAKPEVLTITFSFTFKKCNKTKGCLLPIDYQLEREQFVHLMNHLPPIVINGSTIA